MTDLLDRPAPVAIKEGDETHHYVHCDENRAFCGLDVSNDPWFEGEAPPELLCPECAEVKFCIFCGVRIG